MARGATLKDKTGLAILLTNLVFAYALASHPLGFYLFKIFSAIKEGHAAIMGSYCTVHIAKTLDIKDSSYQVQFIAWTLDSSYQGHIISRTIHIKDSSYLGHRTVYSISRTNHIKNSSYLGQIISRTVHILDKSYRGQEISRTNRLLTLHVKDKACQGQF